MNEFRQTEVSPKGRGTNSLEEKEWELNASSCRSNKAKNGISYNGSEGGRGEQVVQNGGRRSLQ